ncbi:UNVERIFIED_CONTAM: hypothetical protein Sindi_2919600 [Sesamum indicum]
MHAKLAASSTTWTTGLAPLGHISWPKFQPFSVDSGAFSIVGRIRDESAVGSHGEIYRGWGARNGREKAGKLDGGATGGTSNLPGGVTLRTGGATPRAAYAREARRELHDVDNWACPVGPHFVAQISPFSVDSGAFSIVGRIRDESAVGSHGGDIQGLGCAERSRKSRKLDGSEEQFAKRGATRGLPRGSPILRSDRWDVESSGGRNFAHWWSYAASSLCTRSSPRAPRRGQLGLPRWATFRGPKFRRFRWIPARFRSLAAFVMSRPWGLMGRYTGVGVCGTVEKKQEAGRVGRSISPKRGATRGLPRGSPILVLLSAHGTLNFGVLMGSGALVLQRSDRWDVESSGGRNFAHWWSLRREQPMHAKLAASSTTWTTGLAPLGHISWPKFRRFRWIPARFRSLAAFVMSRPWGLRGDIQGLGCAERSRKSRKLDGSEEHFAKKGCNTRTSQGVTHPSTTLAQARLTSEYARFNLLCSSSGATGGTSNLPGGVTLRTGGATPRAAYAREARRELHDVDNWACPVGPHFVAQISPFSVDSGAFSIVGRIRDESAVGSQGEIYRGWGVRNGREKAGSWTGRRSISQKGVQHEDFPGGHPSYSGATGGTSNLPGGVTLRTGGATPRAAYAREARRELHDVDNWACPVGPHFVAQISPFSVDSGAFSIVGRIRDESAVGSHGEIYRGWGCAERSRKSRKLDGWEEQFAKRGATRGLPRGTLNFGVLMGSGALVLRSDRWDVESSGGRNFAHWWSYAASSLCTRSSPASSTTWTTGLAPLGHISWPKFRRFRWIPARFRSLAAFVMSRPWGSHGEIYRGWGARNGREKAGSWTGGRSSFAKRGATRGLPRGSPILRSDRWDVESSGGRNFAHWWSLRREQPMHAKLAASSTTWTTGLAPVVPHFVAQISPFSVDSGAFSIVGRIRDESARGGLRGRYTGEAGRVGGAFRKKGCNTRTSQGVTHPSTTLRPSTLNFGVLMGSGALVLQRSDRWDVESSGGRNFAHWWSLRREQPMHAKLAASSTTWTTGLAPVGPHFVAQIFARFRWIPARFRSLAAFVMSRPWGLMGRYTGVGVRGTVREKAGKLDGWEEHFAKRGATRGLPRGGATGGTSNLPGGVTLRTGGATPRAAYAREARRELHDVDNWACPVGHISWPKFRRFRWIPARFRSLAAFVMSRPWGLMGRYTGVGCAERSRKSGKLDGWEEHSQKGVQHEDFPGGHPSYGATGGTSNLPGGVTLRTGGATPRAAYAREARRELHDVDNWACPVGPHFVAQISPFSVDSGAFSIVGRIRDESAVGSHGEIYRGWGVRNGREKAGSWTGGRSISQKGRSDRWDVESSGGVTLRTGGATPRAAYAREARRELHDVDNWACPVVPHFVAQISPFSVDSARFRSLAAFVMSRPWVSWGDIQGLGCAERSRKSRKLDGGATGGTSNLPGGVTLRTGGATPRAAYAREARRELHDVDNWACPVGHISWPKFRRFRWIPARFRSLAAFVMSRPWGLRGRYTGVGVCGTVEKKQEAGRVGGAVSQKGVQHEDFPGGHPS